MKITALATAGSTVYAQVFRDTDGYVWSVSGAAFEAYATANIANYAILMTQLGSASGIYSATFPTGIDQTTSSYSVIARIKAGGSCAESDVAVGAGVVDERTSDVTVAAVAAQVTADHGSGSYVPDNSAIASIRDRINLVVDRALESDAAATPGYNAISLSRGECQAQRIQLVNPPAGGISGWGSDLHIQVWDDVADTPVIDKTTGFSVVDAADTFEWLPVAADTSGLSPKVYTYKIFRISDGGPVSYGPFVVLP